MHAAATRSPAVAGRFYEADPARLAAEAERFTARAGESCELDGQVAVGPTDFPARLVGGVVPHAGWVCSGRVAGLTWRALADHCPSTDRPPTVFLTGSVHTVDLTSPALDTAAAWQTPLGNVRIDTELRDAIAQLKGFDTLDAAHQFEHAIEVQLPLMQRCFGEPLQFVPCMIPPHRDAIGWGEQLGRLFRDWPAPVIVVASSDLTHHGPRFEYTPHGPGDVGYTWAHQTNDCAVIARIESMAADRVLQHAVEHRSACGGGAIAAVIKAAGALGATRGVTLEHTDSARQLEPLGHADRTHSVGYAGIVFG